MIDQNKTHGVLTDDFRGDDAALRNSIKALIELSDKNALTPHGIGGHARDLLAAAYCRLAPQSPVAPAKESVCKGSFVLGTGCGKCSACLGEIQNHGRPDATTLSAGGES